MPFKQRINDLLHRSKGSSQITAQPVGEGNGAGGLFGQRSSEGAKTVLPYPIGTDDEILSSSMSNLDFGHLPSQSPARTRQIGPALSRTVSSEEKRLLATKTLHGGLQDLRHSAILTENAEVCPRCRKRRRPQSHTSHDSATSGTIGPIGAIDASSCVQSIPIIEKIRSQIEQAAGRPILIDCNRPVKFYSPKILTSAEPLRVNWQLFGHVPFNVVDGLPLLSLSDSKYVLSGSTSSEATFRTIRQWMDTCLLDHPRCHQNHIDISEDMGLPSRLIDVRNSGAKIINYDSSIVAYACLSHCWGASADFAMLTSHNQDIFRREIPAGCLAKTFSEAIDICRHLDIGFLWIDSFCIVQDSADDWAREAAKMASVFDKACLTIVATRAANAQDGCYSEASAAYMTKSIADTPLWFRQLPPPLYPLIGKTIQTNALQSLPIFSRGWIYQELILSRRVLHFSPQEVLWHCRCCIRSESGESDMDFIDGRVSSRSWEWTAALEEDDLVGPHRDFTTESHQVMWHRTIEQYSPLKLTIGTDKLTAISAITRLFEKLRVGDQYLAGLWKQTLLEDLLWRVQPDERLQIPAVQRAPSWSWASVDSGVSWRECDPEVIPAIFTRIDGIQYTPEGESYLGNCRQQSSLTLIGPLLETKVFISKTDTHSSTGIICTFDFARKLQGYVPKMTAMLDVSPVPELRGEFYPDAELFLAIVRADGNAIEGIILLKQAERFTYRRVGYALLSGVTATDVWAKILPQATFTIT